MNPTSDKLRQLAQHAPFLMEKENYLQAADEIDRLQNMIDQIKALIHQDSHK